MKIKVGNVLLPNNIILNFKNSFWTFWILNLCMKILDSVFLIKYI